MTSSGYQELIKSPKRPRLLEAIRETGKQSYIAITSSLLALIIALLSLVVPSPSLKGFFQWLFIILLLLAGVVLVVSTAIYLVRMFRYMSRLEQRILQIRRVFLASSGVEDVEPGRILRYSLGGIVNQQGTVNLVIDLHERSGLRPGSLLDVVVTATGEVWGAVKVSRVDDEQAWASPVDRRNPDFWEVLEDRMMKDPSPPSGIHLEPLLSPAIRKLLLPDTEERTVV